MIDYMFFLGKGCVSAYIFFEYIELLYTRRYCKKIIYWCGLIFYIIVSFFAKTLNSPIINVLCTVFVMGLINLLLYEVNGKNYLINFIIYFLYIILVDTVISTAFSIVTSSNVYEISGTQTMYLLSGVVYAIVLICTHRIVIQFIQRNPIPKSSMAIKIYMIFLLAFEVMIISYFITIKFWSVPIFFISIGFASIYIGIIYLYKLIFKNMRLEKQIELLNQQREMTNKYYQENQKKYIEAQKLLHDFKKHIQIVEGLSGGEEKIKEEYIDSLINRINTLELKFKCSNRIINIIVWNKMQQCIELGIDFNIHMQDISFNFMSDMEVTSLFANLLDNSINSCEDSGLPKKSVDMRIHKFKNHIVINLKNTVGSEPILRNGKLVSKKAEHYGLGIIILEEIVNKYNGNLGFEYMNNYFITKIIFVEPEK